MKITKYWIRKWGPCHEAVDWIKGQDTNDVFKLIKRLRKSDEIDKNNWLIWAIPRLLETKKDRVKFAVYAASLALPEYEKKYPNDSRPRDAIRLVRKWLRNPRSVSQDELKVAAEAAALAAAEAAWAAAWAAAEIKIINYGVRLLKEQEARIT